MSKRPARYGIDETIKLPITLENDAGVAHVRAIFWRVKKGGSIGPRGLAPSDTLELRGNGDQEKRVTVHTTLKVDDQHVPGEYLCVAIQVYDPEGNVTVIRNPAPPMSVLIAANAEKSCPGPIFLGWGDQPAS